MYGGLPAWNLYGQSGPDTMATMGAHDGHIVPSYPRQLMGTEHSPHRMLLAEVLNLRDSLVLPATEG